MKNQKKKAKPEVLGTLTRYVGKEKRFGGRGAVVMIVGIVKNGDGADHVHVTDDATLSRLGGVRAGDRAEVYVWLPKRGWWSNCPFEVSDVTDLERFAGLRSAP